MNLCEVKESNQCFVVKLSVTSKVKRYLDVIKAKP